MHNNSLHLVKSRASFSSDINIAKVAMDPNIFTRVEIKSFDTSPIFTLATTSQQADHIMKFEMRQRLSLNLKDLLTFLILFISRVNLFARDRHQAFRA